METTDRQFVQEKRQLLKRLEIQYGKWDGSVEKALVLFSENEKLFNQIEVVDKELSYEARDLFAQEYQGEVKKILSQHKKMVSRLSKAKEEVQNEISSANKKKQIVKDYIQQEESLFVDRDV